MPVLLRSNMRFLFIAWLFGSSSYAVDRVQIEVALYSVQSGLLTHVIAKELCSCLFVDGMTQKECELRDNLPPLIHKVVIPKINKNGTVVAEYDVPDIIEEALGHKINPKDIGPSATAKYINPKLGCQISQAK